MNVPSYQAIDFLRRAEQSEAPREVVRELYNKVMEENTSLPKLRKAYEAEVFPLTPADKKAREVTGLRNVGGRLLSLIQESENVSSRLKGRVAEALEELLSALQEQAA
jgi:hypothetical protein